MYRDFVIELRKLAQLDGWSKERIADMAGIHVNTLRNLYSDALFNPTLKTIEKLVAVLELSNKHNTQHLS